MVIVTVADLMQHAMASSYTHMFHTRQQPPSVAARVVLIGAYSPALRTCTAAAAAAACSAASAALLAALLAAAEYAAARCDASMAAPLARMAMCARSLMLGSEGSVGNAASSALVTALAGGSTCIQQHVKLA
jgi:hypothetical protein